MVMFFIQKATGKPSAATGQAKQEAKSEESKPVETSPPESIFKALKPSEHRYTVIRNRDEL